MTDPRIDSRNQILKSNAQLEIRKGKTSEGTAWPTVTAENSESGETAGSLLHTLHLQCYPLISSVLESR